MPVPWQNLLSCPTEGFKYSFGLSKKINIHLTELKLLLNLLIKGRQNTNFSIPGFKDTVNVKVKVFPLWYFSHKYYLWKLHHFPAKNKHAGKVLHMASVRVYSAHFCGWALPMQVATLAYTVWFEGIIWLLYSKTLLRNGFMMWWPLGYDGTVWFHLNMKWFGFSCIMWFEKKEVGIILFLPLLYIQVSCIIFTWICGLVFIFKFCV